MLKIMIRENSTQRGNENFGAVLDSVGAVLVQCVREAFKGFPNGETRGNREIIKSFSDGNGIGNPTIMEKEPSFIKKHVESALKTFRTTGIYLQLLKKGGLPEKFWHLYEKSPITTIEAVAMFPKPAHAAAWVKNTQDDLIQNGFELNPQEVEYALTWLELKNPDRAVPYKVAISQGRKLMKQGAPVGNQNASVLNVKNKGDNITFEVTESNDQKQDRSKSYLKARLERDNPELFSKVQSGELSESHS